MEWFEPESFDKYSTKKYYEEVTSSKSTFKVLLWCFGALGFIVFGFFTI